ncbi:MAG: DUF1801 domain-containing protein [Flavipsychrobacter sp.]|nr:DUF1801 domain-containing protein [Flavipsychrobacter sp.]
MDNRIDQFFLSLPDSKRLLAIEIREIILYTEPSLTEAIKWNQLTFSLGKANIAFIYALSEASYINLGFFKATLLTDPRKLLEGTGKKMRHLKLYSGKPVEAKQISSWVSEACELEGIRK